jgi:hypothetical protein
MDARKDFPNVADVAALETEDGTAYHLKTDVFKRLMWYHYKDKSEEVIPVSIERILEIKALNRQGKKVASLVEGQPYKPMSEGQKRAFMPTPASSEVRQHDYKSAVGEDDVTRFDKSINQKTEQKHHHSSQERNAHNRNTHITNGEEPKEPKEHKVRTRRKKPRP